MNEHRTNAEALRIIKSREALRLKAYLCPSGEWTIGYGHTSDDNFQVHAHSAITKEKAAELFRIDVAEAENRVRQQVKVNLNINQFSALVSFVFNVGSLKLKNGKDSTLLVYLNALCFQEAANEFMKWIYADGKKLDGLIERRREEKRLFLTEPV